LGWSVRAPVVAADCMGPTITGPSTSVDRGQTTTIEGAAFGDSCYDTGPPPPGQGVLGRPVTDIELVITQGSTDIVVARGDADAHLGFSVEIVVPPSLAPGAATLSARSARPAGVAAPRALTISTAPAVAGEQSVVTFGPNVGVGAPATIGTAGEARGEAGLSAVGTPDEGSGTSRAWALPLALALGLVAGAAIVIRRRRPAS